MDCRVVISGIGAISALGRGVERHAEELVAGRRRMGLPRILPGAATGPVAEVQDELLPRFAPEHQAVSSRGARLALAAFDEAVEGARLGAAELARAALYVGTTSSGILEGESVLAGVRPGMPRPAYRHFDDQYVAGAIGRALARARAVGGPRRTISTACSSSASALASAGEGIASGRIDLAIVLGVDTLTRMTYFGFGSLNLLSPEPCRPFDERRQGLTLGEAAACLVLESASGNAARGAAPRAALLGWARNVDGHHITQPDPEGRGIEDCMRQALARASLGPSDVDHVNAHGTGTPQNDLVEGRVIGRVLGARVPVTSTKSYTGHTLGAAGAIEAVASVLAIRDGFVPATLGLERLDPALDLNVVSGSCLRMRSGVVLSSSFGFGGNNCSIVLGRAEGAT